MAPFRHLNFCLSIFYLPTGTATKILAGALFDFTLLTNFDPMFSEFPHFTFIEGLGDAS